MFIKNVRKVTCPYCTTVFSVGSIYKGDKKKISYGTLICSCDEFPVIEGIICLDRKKHKHILNLMQHSDYIGALLFAVFNRSLHARSIIGLFKIYALVYLGKVYFDKGFRSPLIEFLFGIIYRDKSAALYSLRRDTEIDAFLLYLPLAFVNKKNINWLNIGSGLRTFYADFKAHRITFFSVESNFLDIFLSSKLFESSNTIYLNYDIVQGIPTSLSKTDVVTFIDSLQIVENPRRCLQQVLNDSKSPLVLATSLVEHQYLPLSDVVFPIKRSVITGFVQNKKATILNHNLVANMFESENMIDLNKAIISKTAKMNRYILLYNFEKKLRVFNNPLPKHIRDKATLVWTEYKVKWSNNRY